MNSAEEAPAAPTARPRRAEVLGLGGLVAAFGAFHLWWWHRYRRGFPWFIDEAGYLSFALDHGAAISDGSLSALWDGLDRQVPAAPLVPLASGTLLTAGEHPFAAAAVTMALSAAGLVVASWFLARWYLPSRWALAAAATVGALPTVLTLSGTYYFAPAAAACFTAGLGCLARSGWGARYGWSAAAGLAFALAALARTMLIGFLPAVAVVAVAVAVGACWRAQRRADWPEIRRRMVGLAIAGAAAVVALAPWFLTNLDSIIDYLGSPPPPVRTGGGGARGARASWDVPGMRDLRLLVGDLLVPMAVAVLAASVVVVGVSALRVRRRAPRHTPQPPARPATWPLLAILGLGSLTLVGTEQAVGQWLPLLPLLVVVVLTGTNRWAPVHLRRLVLASFLALAVFHVASASRLNDDLSRLRLIDAGGLGRLPVTDTRTLLEDQLTQELDGGSLNDRFRQVPVLLEAVMVETQARSADAGEPAVLLVSGGSDPLMNVNSLQLADHLAGGGEAIVGALALVDLDAAGFAELLADPARGQPNAVLTVTPFGRSERLLESYRTLTATLPSVGFEEALVASLPDGRPFTLWWRPRAAIG